MSAEDGIEFEEFFDFVQTLSDPAGELIEAFKKYDRNGDGFIDKTEIRGKTLVIIQYNLSTARFPPCAI